MAISFAHTEILLACAKAQHALTAQRNLYMIRPRATQVSLPLADFIAIRGQKMT